MKFFIIISLIFYSVIYSQDDESKNPNVELPDFVITGQDEVSIKQAEKMKPDFISTITQEFITPLYSSEDLGLRQISNPIKENLNLLDPGQFSNGSLFAGAGIYTIPKAGINYSYPFTNGILKAELGGMYQSAHIQNSDRYSLNGGASIDYTVGIDNKALSGTRFLLGGNYRSLSYKLFSSSNPTTRKTKNEGNYFVGVKNATGEVFIFDLNIRDKFTSLVEHNFSENIININGFARIMVSDINVGIKTDYQKQFIKTDSLGSKDYDYIFARPVISFEVFNSIKVGAGYSFTKSGTKKFNDIYASIGLKIFENMVLLGEYTPAAEFLTSGIFLRKNDYFNPNMFSNLFFRKSNSLNISVKYEYEKYYQVDAGVKYFKSGNFPYYSVDQSAGQFNLLTADVENYSVYVNSLFHFGPYGFLYGDVKYSRVRDKSNKIIPYQPELVGNITYGYELFDGFLGEVKFNSLYNMFADLNNEIKLNSFVDMGLKFTYKTGSNIIITLELSNIFNRKIFLWQDYQEKPFDLFAGFDLLFD